MFSLLRLRFNAVLTQFDLFNNALTQRSEREIGVWLSGLDVVSADALRLPGDYYDAPPVICYLDRGRRRSHSPGPDAASRRWRESSRRHSRAEGAHGGQRHRVFAGA